MSTGVTVSEQCQSVFQELKLGKKFKYVIYRLNDTNSEIIVEKTSTSTNYDEFLEDLPETEPRYAVYDFEYEKGGDGKRNKLCFVSWSPDNSKIKLKMVYAASKDALRRSLQGLATEIQGTDISEVAYDSVLEKVSRGA